MLFPLDGRAGLYRSIRLQGSARHSSPKLRSNGCRRNVGYGGHSRGTLEKSQPGGILYGAGCRSIEVTGKQEARLFAARKAARPLCGKVNSRVSSKVLFGDSGVSHGDTILV